MKKQLYTSLLKIMLQRFIGLGLFLLGSKGALNWQVALYFSYAIVLTLILSIIVARKNPAVLAARNRLEPSTPLIDKILVISFWLLDFFVLYLIIGLEFTAVKFEITSLVFGLVLITIGSLLATAALIVNPFLEVSARIQTDKTQSVVTAGVYQIVRHPTYLANLLTSLGMALIFLNLKVFIMTALIWIIVFLRTYFEDKLLQENLIGYTDYQKQVTDLLIPHVW